MTFSSSCVRRGGSSLGVKELLSLCVVQGVGGVVQNGCQLGHRLSATSSTPGLQCIITSRLKSISQHSNKFYQKINSAHLYVYICIHYMLCFSMTIFPLHFHKVRLSFVQLVRTAPLSLVIVILQLQLHTQWLISS